MGAPAPGAFPGLGGLGGGQLDANMIQQTLQNPMVQQMMQNMAANPQILQSVMRSPMFEAMARQNPMFQQVMNNPQMMQAMLNPQMLQAMFQMQAGMHGMQPTAAPVSGAPVPAAEGAGAGAVPAAGTTPGLPGLMDPATLQALQAMNMMGGMGGMGAMGGAGGGLPGAMGAALEVPPEQRFATQLEQLHNMGFTDRPSNVQALQMANGDINQAITFLLGPA